MPRDEYDWMTTAEAIERIEVLMEAEAAEASLSSPFVLETKLQFTSPFSLAADVVALRKAMAALRAQDRPDPLGEALNSGDGVYRP